MDASALLAESEELLAILDTPPAAFAASDSAFSRANTVECMSAPRAWGTRDRAGVLKTAPVPESEDDPSVLRSAADKTVKKSKSKELKKDPRDEKLEQQRKVVRKLENDLALLRQQKQSSALVSSKRAQVWREFATHQLRWRQLAEAENQQLKNTLLEVLQSDEPRQLERYLGVDGEAQMARMMCQLSSYSHGPRKLAIASSLRDDAALRSVFTSLLRRLDAGLAEIDAVFRENGMDQALTEPRSYAEKRTRRLGEARHFVEIVHIRLAPFDWRHFGNIVWKCTREWHLKDEPYVFPCADRPDDTFAVNYRVSRKGVPGDNGQQSANFSLAVRRYTLADRLVVVFASQSHGENELAGATVSTISYVVTSSVSSLSVPGASPVSVVQNCMHLSSTRSSSSSSSYQDDQAKAKSLMSLLMDAFQDDMVHISRHVGSSLVLQGARTRCDPRAPTSTLENGEQVQQDRFSFESL